MRELAVFLQVSILLFKVGKLLNLTRSALLIRALPGAEME
jgi:hypothetical protein